jgi:hypothetical protein
VGNEFKNKKSNFMKSSQFSFALVALALTSSAASADIQCKATDLTTGQSVTLEKKVEQADRAEYGAQLGEVRFSASINPAMNNHHTGFTMAIIQNVNGVDVWSISELPEAPTHARVATSAGRPWYDLTCQKD